MVVMLFTPTLSQSQLFAINGDASDNGGGCYELTPNAKGKLGSIWSPSKVSLNNSFVVTGKFNFGSKNWWEPAGADGIAFALQPISSTVGNPGAALGVGGISPALVVEFDTYKNGWDPAFQHAAIVQNGEPDHITFPPLDGPVGIKAGNADVTDGNWYNYRFEWDAVAQKFTVDIDCQEILSYSGDMIQDIFGGISDVYWGFSSATGDKFSHHQVCVDATNLYDLQDQSICLGGTATVTLPTLGSNYSINSWSPISGIVSTSITAPHATFSPSVTTEYVLTLTDDCNDEIKDTFNLTIEPAPTVDLGNDTNVCGAQNIILDAGNAGSTYLWNTGATTQTISTAGAGTYFVEVTNPTGCAASDTIIVGTSGSLTVALGPDSAFCGPVNLPLDAGNAGSTYLWSSGASTKTITASAAGIYFVEVTSASGCKGYDTLVVTQANGLTVSLGNDTTICDGNTVLLYAGNVGSTYSWNTGANSHTITVSTTGSYFVEVTSASGCKGYDTIQVIVNVQPVAGITPSDTIVACTNDYPVVLNASIWIGTYEWNDGSTGLSLSANSQGDYWVILTVLGCSDTDSVYVKDSPVLALDLGNDTVICGTSYVMDGGAGHATYEWQETPANNTQTFTASTTGSNDYILKVTNAAGCETIDTINVTLNPKPTALDILDTSLCSENFPVVLDATQGAVSYLWNDATTNPTLSANAAGDYWVIVTQNNCSDTDSVTVSLNGAPTVNLGNDTTLCVGESMTLDAGNVGSTFLWSGIGTGSTQTTFVNTAGKYYVNVTNSNGCIGTDSIQVSIGSLSVNLGPDTALCSGENFILDATTANATYLWNTAATTATIDASATGTYSVIVTNGNGCEGKDTVEVSTKAGPIISLGGDTAICNGNTLTLDAGTGVGYNYLWNTTASTQTILITGPGTYYVDVTTAGSTCAGTDTIIVQFSNNLSVNIGQDTTLCDGANVSLKSGIPGATYLWSNAAGTQDITVNTAGIYHVLVTDGNNCEGRDTLIVQTSTAPIVSLGQDVSSCNGITMTLDAQNTGESFLWNTGATLQTINITSAGIYFVDVTNSDNCVARDSITVTAVINNTVVDLGPDSTFCDVIFYTRNAGNPGSTYTWSTGSTLQSINIVAAGTYFIEVTDGNNCVAVDTVIIKLGAAVNVDLGPDMTICDDSTATLTASAGSSFSWSDGSNSQTLMVSTAGVYSVTVKNNDNCTGNDNITVAVNAKPAINITNSTNIACLGDTVIVTTGNTVDAHLWSNGTTNDSTILTTQHGLLSVTITDALGCTSTGTAVPVNFQNVSVDLNDVHYHCTGTTTIINPNNIDPNYIYDWSSSGDVISGGLNTGTDGIHIVTALLNIGNKFCSASDTTLLVSVGYPSVSIAGDTIACEGESIALDAISSDAVSWSNGVNGYVNTVTTTGTHYATASLTTNGKTCVTMDSIKVRFDAFPELLETPQFSHCFEYDKNFTIFTNVVGENYEWSHSLSTAPIANAQNEGVYTVTVYDNKKCTVTIDIEVKEKCPISLYVPNAFSPNSDGINETFTVIGHNAETFELTIFNRWGEIVFKSTDGSTHWNGTMNGHEVQEDVYIWKAKITGYDENYQYRIIDKMGTITLVR
jgi:gliding motility-associated-like protein